MDNDQLLRWQSVIIYETAQCLVAQARNNEVQPLHEWKARGLPGSELSSCPCDECYCTLVTVNKSDKKD